MSRAAELLREAGALAPEGEGPIMRHTPSPAETTPEGRREFDRRMAENSPDPRQRTLPGARPAWEMYALWEAGKLR